MKQFVSRRLLDKVGRFVTNISSHLNVILEFKEENKIYKYDVTSTHSSKCHCSVNKAYALHRRNRYSIGAIFLVLMMQKSLTMAMGFIKLTINLRYYENVGNQLYSIL